MAARVYRSIVPIFAGLAVLIGALVLLAWAIGDGEPLRLTNAIVTMKANTGLGVAMIGAATLLAWRQRGSPELTLRWALEIGVLMLAALNILQYAANIDLGIDEFLASARRDDLLTAQPGRMSVATAIGFLLASLALLVDHVDKSWARGLSRSMATVLFALGMLVCIGYLYNVPTLYFADPGGTAMSPMTAAMFMMLAASIVGIHPRYGFAALLMQRTLPARQLRTLLPAMLLLPVMVGLIGVEMIPVVGPPVAVALTAFGSALIAALIVLVSTVYLRSAESELVLRDEALAAAHVGVVITQYTQTGNPIVWANDAFCRMTDTRHADVIGRHVNFPISSADGQDHEIAEINELIEAGQACNVTFRARHRDGSQLWNRLSLSPVTGRNGRVTHYIGILDDVTTERNYQAELRASLERVEEARQAAEAATVARDTFVSFVSHELRGPLNSALTWAELMEMAGTEENISKGIAVIKQSIHAQTRLIRDLGDVARVTSGQLAIERHPFDLRAMLSDLAEELRPQIEEQQLSFNVSLNEGPVWIDADSVRIQQAFRNLIVNAGKYTKSGGEISVGLQHEGDSVTVSVSDTGIGLEPQEREKVFDPFWQANTHAKGLGVGLAIVQSIIRAHGGTIQVESPGKNGGSTFSVTLAVRAVSVEQAVNLPAADQTG